MWKQVVPLFVIAVLVGWLMPAHDPMAKPAEAEPVTAKPKSVAAPANFNDVPTRSANTGEVVLIRANDGHFYAPGTADTAALRFLVDTGASVVALTEADAQSLGHYVHPGELTVVGRGVNGEVKGKSIMLGRLSIGAISSENVRAVIIPDGLRVSLLGQSFLSRVAHVTISGNQMTLKN